MRVPREAHCRQAWNELQSCIILRTLLNGLGMWSLVILAYISTSRTARRKPRMTSQTTRSDALLRHFKRRSPWWSGTWWYDCQKFHIPFASKSKPQPASDLNQARIFVPERLSKTYVYVSSMARNMALRLYNISKSIQVAGHLRSSGMSGMDFPVQVTEVGQEWYIFRHWVMWYAVGP